MKDIRTEIFKAVFNPEYKTAVATATNAESKMTRLIKKCSAFLAEKDFFLGYPTIADIAKTAGVSTTTVSRVISDSDQVKPKTKQKVQNVINELTVHKYKEDKNGTSLSIPMDRDNHGIDSIRYSCESEMLSRDSGMRIIEY